MRFPAPRFTVVPGDGGRGVSTVGTDSLPPMTPAQPDSPSARARTRLVPGQLDFAILRSRSAAALNVYLHTPRAAAFLGPRLARNLARHSAEARSVSALLVGGALGAARRRISRVPDEEGLGHRVVAIVREREQHARGTLGAGKGAGASRQHHGGRLAPLAAHLELSPLHPHAEPGAEGLQGRLLRSEAGGQVRDRIAAAAAVGDLVLGEDAAEKALVPALDDAAQPRHLREVHAHALHVRHRGPMACLMMPESSAAMASMWERSSPSTITRARFSVPE